MIKFTATGLSLNGKHKRSFMFYDTQDDIVQVWTDEMTDNDVNELRVLFEDKSFNNCETAIDYRPFLIIKKGNQYFDAAKKNCLKERLNSLMSSRCKISYTDYEIEKTKLAKLEKCIDRNRAKMSKMTDSELALFAQKSMQVVNLAKRVKIAEKAIQELKSIDNAFYLFKEYETL